MLRETLLVGMLALALAPPAVDDPLVEPPTEDFSVQLVVHPALCSATSLVGTPDSSRLPVRYESRWLEVSDRAGITSAREDCTIAFDMSLPAGYTYAVARIIHRGEGHLADGVDPLLITRMSHSDDSHYRHDYHFADPFVDDHLWAMAHDIEPAARLWAPCGGRHRLSLSYMLRLSVGTAAPGAISYLTFNATNAEDGGTALELVWKRCSPETPLAGARPGPTVDGMAHEAMTTTPGNPRRSTAMR